MWCGVCACVYVCVCVSPVDVSRQKRIPGVCVGVMWCGVCACGYVCVCVTRGCMSPEAHSRCVCVWCGVCVRVWVCVCVCVTRGCESQEAHSRCVCVWCGVVCVRVCVCACVCGCVAIPARALHQRSGVPHQFPLFTDFGMSSKRRLCREQTETGVVAEADGDTQISARRALGGQCASASEYTPKAKRRQVERDDLLAP